MPEKTSTLEHTLRYRGYHGCLSRCRIQVYDNGSERPYVVIATELEDNPGTSITNAAEIVAGEVWKLLEKPARTMVWIEHYPDRCFLGERPMLREQWDLVRFEQVGNCFLRPKWRRISKEEVERICEGAIFDLSPI